MNETEVETPQEDNETSHAYDRDHELLIDSIHDLGPKDKAVLVIARAVGTKREYIVETFNCEDEPHEAMGILQAGIAWEIDEFFDKNQEGDEEPEAPAENTTDDEAGG